MRILTIDLGTNCGWAAVGNTGALIGGMVQCHGLTDGERYASFVAHLVRLFGLYRPERVIFEMVAYGTHKGSRQAVLHGGYRGVLELVCAWAGLPAPTPIHVATIKASPRQAGENR